MLSPTGHPASSAQTPPTSPHSVPQALARLPAGSLVTGTVTGRDATGQLLVRTDAGTLPLETRLDLARGTVVTLRVGEGVLFTATIESVDGRPVATTARAPAPALAPAPAPAPAAGGPPQAPAASSLTVNNTLAAVVIATQPDAASSLRPIVQPGMATGLPALATGDRVALQIISIGAAAGPAVALTPAALAAPSANGTPVPPATAPLAPPPAAGSSAVPATALPLNTAPAPAASATTPVSTAGAEAVVPRPPGASPTSPGAAATSSPGSPTPGAATASTGPVATPAAPAPTGLAAQPAPAKAPVTDGQAQPRTAAAQGGMGPAPSGAAAATAAQGGIGPAIAATVVAVDSSGRPLLSTALGTFQVETRAPLAVGTTLRLTLAKAEPQAPAAPTTPVSVTRADSLLGLAHDWPALREAIDALRHINPGLADRVVQRTIATPGANLAQSALFFLSALRGGDVTGWLGRGVVRALEDGGRGDLVRRLVADFGQIARLADPPSSGEWQPILVPLHDGERLRQLRLFVRRHRGDDEGAEGGTRFIVDIELSRLGELQLDGLIYERRFDLILRSHEAMAADARRDIAAIFADGLSTAGLVGRLSFQVARAFPVAPLDEIFAGDHDGVLV